MRSENRRVVVRKNAGKTIIEDRELGMVVLEHNNGSHLDLGLYEFELLDYSLDGNILLLNSKKWVTGRNTNKTRIEAFNLESNKSLFSSEIFLGYRAMIDSTSSRFLLEYWQGLASLDLFTGAVIFKKDKIEKSLYHADLHIQSNTVYIPTEKKSLITFNFDSNHYLETRIEKIASTTWVKFNSTQDKLLVSDKKNFLHCFSFDSLTKPIWSIDFSKFGKNGRIWCFDILVTESNLGCVHGFTPGNKGPYSGGALWIFDIESGKILNQYDYANFDQKVICGYAHDQIVLDDLSLFSLVDLKISRTELSHVLENVIPREYRTM